MTKKIKALALKVETSQNQNLPPLTTRIQLKTEINVKVC